MLLANGADVNAKDEYGNTALHKLKRREVLQLLLANGAEVNAKDKFSHTPLWNAAWLGG